uniref:Coiled-coil domain-containing protein 167 n=1 Tax=Heterorhabditis bacteriophora TaxID=37862 RepID=A0A1I7X6R6_HETBA
MPEGESARDRLIMSNLRLMKQRYEIRCSELEQINNKLIIEMDESKKREMRNYIAIAVFVVSYIILCTINGN